MRKPYRITNPCTTRLVAHCHPARLAAVKAASPFPPDEELPDRLCFGVWENDCFDGTFQGLNEQLMMTTLSVWEHLDALVKLTREHGVTYRLEVCGEFYWKEADPDEGWDWQISTLLCLLDAELVMEFKWREERMWRVGRPQGHMAREPVFEEIESMDELALADSGWQEIVDTLAHHSGLFALCGNRGFGVTTLQMQLAAAALKQRGGRLCVLSTELLEEQYRLRMAELGLGAAEAIILDEIHTVAGLKAFLQTQSDVSLVVIDRPALLKDEPREGAWAERLKRLADALELPVLITGGLVRSSGEGDPCGRPSADDVRPYQLWYFADVILLLHRDHDLQRDVGHTRRSGLADATEVIVKKNRFGGLDIGFLRWDPAARRFEEDGI